ncbi:transmembrane protein 203 [Oratosquilla oratoria]|uniref:transmembrane protein 203 n=1 Tax=Oratosquilla oratoria TaxID=337810 RepID=UPI003F769DD0
MPHEFTLRRSGGLTLGPSSHLTPQHQQQQQCSHTTTTTTTITTTSATNTPSSTSTTIMFFTLRELTKWLGITVLEIWITLVSLLVTLVLVSLKMEGILAHTSWWVILSPLFIADALNTYFCVIVFIRTYLDGTIKPAALRALWSFSVLILVFIFKFLLCRKLSDNQSLEYSAVMSPIFILLQLIMIRACHHN